MAASLSLDDFLSQKEEALKPIPGGTTLDDFLGGKKEEEAPQRAAPAPVEPLPGVGAETREMAPAPMVAGAEEEETAPLLESLKSYPARMIASTAAAPSELQVMRKAHYANILQRRIAQYEVRRDSYADDNPLKAEYTRRVRKAKEQLATAQHDLEAAQLAASSSRAHQRDVTPPNESTLGQIGGIVAESAAPVIAGVGTFMATGNPALAAGVGGGLGAAQQMGATAAEAVEKGVAGIPAAHAGVRAGLYEFAGEMAGGAIFFKTLNKLAADAALSIAKKLAIGAGVDIAAEGASELVTQLAQDIDAKLTWNPDLTWDEIKRNAALATGAGVLGGAVFGGTATGVSALADRSRKAAEDKKLDDLLGKEIDRSMARLPTAEAAALRQTLVLPQPTGVVQGAPYTGEPITLPEAPVPQVTLEGQPVTPGTASITPTTPEIGGTQLGGVTQPELPTPEVTPTAVVRSVPQQLTQAISQGRGLDYVADNMKTLKAEGIRPATVALQAYRARLVDKDTFKAFVEGLQGIKVGEEIEASVRLDEIDRQLKIIDDNMREEAEAEYVPTEQTRREVSDTREVLNKINTVATRYEVARRQGGSQAVSAQQVANAQADALVREYSSKVGILAKMRNLGMNVRSIEGFGVAVARYLDDLEARLAGAPVSYGMLRPPGSMGHFVSRPKAMRVSYANKASLVGRISTKAMQAGDVAVTDSFDQKTARAIVSVLTRWLKLLHPEGKVLVVDLQDLDVNGRQSFYSSDPDTIVIEMNVRKLQLNRANGKLSPRAIEILSHEFAHGLVRTFFQKEPAHVQEALVKAWNKHVMERLDKTFKQYIEETRGAAAVASHNWDMSWSGSRTLRELFMSRLLDDYSGQNVYEYWTNFDEWTAHNMERMLKADYADMVAPVRAFLRKSVKKLVDLFRLARGDGLPNQTFHQWMTAHKLGAQARALEANLAMIQQLSKQMAPQAGELADIEQALQEDVPPVKPEGLSQIVVPKPPAWARNIQISILGHAPVTHGEALMGLPDHVLNNMAFRDADVGAAFGGFGRNAGMSPQDASGFERDLDKFSGFKRWAYTLINVARVNPHIKELWNPTGISDPSSGRTLYGYIDYVIKWANERMLWMEQADKTLRRWRKLSLDQADLLSRFMLDQTVAGTYFDLRDPQIQQRYPFRPETLELFQRVDGDFKQFITAIEETLVIEAQARLAQNPMLTQEIRRIRQQFEDLRQRPYFPLSRFGKYSITVRASQDGQVNGVDHKAGDTLYFSTYDWQVERDLDFGKVARMYPGQNVQKSKVSETVRSFAGIPTPLIEALKTRLNLTPEQREELNNYLYEIAPGQSFVKHLIRRKNTPGFSWDAERAYAGYFLHGSNHLARLKYRDLLGDAHKRLVATARAPGVEDATKRMEISNYVANHLDYIMNPENDWAGVRGAIAVAYLGGMLKTAWVNLTQVPMVTYPELARQHGDHKAIPAIIRAYGDLLKMYRATRSLTQGEEQIIQKWINGQPLTRAEEHFIEKWSGLDRQDRAALIRAMQEGFIDQSYAMELAGMAGGGWLSRFHVTNQAGYYAREFTHALMVPFEMGERINRRVSFIAALRLARQAGLSENDAYLNARQVVYDTQYEYSRWNRPELLRGKKGIVFMFMQYVLNTLFFAMGGANKWYSAWRWWALMLYATGLMGLPFAENAKDLAAWAWNKVNPNKRLNLDYEMKKLLRPIAEMLHTSPDAFLHGAARYGFGLIPFADLSGSMSLGRVIPGTDVLEATSGGMKWNDAVAKSVTEVGGATSSLVMRMLKAVASDDPDTLRRVEQGIPFSLGQSMMTALRWYQQGGEETWNGARVVGFDPNDPWQMAEIIGKGIFGLQPGAISMGRPDESGYKEPGQIGYDEFRIRQDFAHFYAIRRQHLMEQLDHFRENNDTENVHKTLDEIRTYNQTAPSSAKLTTGDIRRSLEQRQKARKGIEMGKGTSRLERGIARDVAEERL